MMDTELLGHEVLRRLLLCDPAERSRLDGRSTAQRRATAVVQRNLVAPIPPPAPGSGDAATAYSMTLSSALVSHGSTLVLCVVSAQLSPVLPDAPDRGFAECELVYNAASLYGAQRSEASTMQPSADERDTLWTAEATTLLQRALDLSRCVNVGALLVSEGEACLALKLTCLVMQDDGGVLEAAAASMRAALESCTTLPTEVVLPDGTRQPWSPPPASIAKGSERTPLLLRPVPSVMTVCFFFCAEPQQQQQQQQQEHQRLQKAYPTEATEVIMVVDPTATEASVADGFVTMAVSPVPGRGNSVIAMTVHGGKPVAADVLAQLTRFAEQQQQN